jgi:hypothetical protein
VTARALALPALLLAAVTAVAALEPGHYDARFCVTVAAQAPQCGQAELDWRKAGRARLRISDIVYSLHFKTSQVDVVLLHGAMQIDGFTAAYEWRDGTLHFVDAEKNVRYEVQPAARRSL